MNVGGRRRAEDLSGRVWKNGNVSFWGGERGLVRDWTAAC